MHIRTSETSCMNFALATYRNCVSGDRKFLTLKLELFPTVKPFIAGQFDWKERCFYRICIQGRAIIGCGLPCLFLHSTISLCYFVFRDVVFCDIRTGSAAVRGVELDWSGLFFESGLNSVLSEIPCPCDSISLHFNGLYSGYLLDAQLELMVSSFGRQMTTGSSSALPFLESCLRRMYHFS